VADGGVAVVHVAAGCERVAVRRRFWIGDLSGVVPVGMVVIVFVEVS
jgi:hypothetical protein